MVLEKKLKPQTPAPVAVQAARLDAAPRVRETEVRVEEVVEVLAGAVPVDRMATFQIIAIP